MTSSKLVYREEVPSGMVQFGTIKLVEVQNELKMQHLRYIHPFYTTNIFVDSNRTLHFFHV